MRFSLIQHVLTVPAAIFAAIIWGVAAVPSYLLFLEIKEWLVGQSFWVEIFGIAMGPRSTADMWNSRWAT